MTIEKYDFKIKRYLYFKFEPYGSDGGFDDLKYSFDSYKELNSFIDRKSIKQFSWLLNFQIIDTITQTKYEFNNGEEFIDFVDERIN